MTRAPTITRFLAATLLLRRRARRAGYDCDARHDAAEREAAAGNRRHVEEKTDLFTVRDAWLAVGVAGGVLALYPVDKSLAVKMQNENTAPGGKALNSWANGSTTSRYPACTSSHRRFISRGASRTTTK